MRDRRFRADADVWVRRGCAVVVSSVAAYASYVHQREFALQGGADGTSATVWPLAVDGLLLLATVGLLRPAPVAGRRGRVVVWLAFLFGIAVSLAANIAAAPALSWQPVLVAGWPPVALLLSVELLTHRQSEALPREAAGTPIASAASRVPVAPAAEPREALARRDRDPTAHQNGGALEPGQKSGANAEAVMWAHFQQEQSRGRTPTGAELDRVAGTNNYGRAVVARWRRTGRIPDTRDEQGGRR